MQQVFRVALPPRTQNGAIDYIPYTKDDMAYEEGGCWRLWLHTPNFIHGTYLMLYSNGRVERVTVREDEGDEIVVIKE